MVVLACESNGEWKATMKNLKLEDTSSRKFGCQFR